ncbi:MAG: TlpA family protein disulfide reductase [Paludibacter sp.]|jgi:thiol-disulfide isomerase/thioredoxin|nr:TlpA family protein disulfide reductase [Paludibacter sp.]
MRKLLLLFFPVLCCCVQSVLSQPKVGETAPIISNLKLLTSESLDLSDKFICLDFWATWCGPCIKSFPHVNDLAEKYKGEIVFLAVSSEPEDKVRDFIEKYNYDNIYWAIDEQLNLTIDFSVKIIPTFYLISPDNKILSTGNSYELSIEYLDELISSNNTINDNTKVSLESKSNLKSTIEIKEIDNYEKTLQQNDNTFFARDSLYILLAYLDGVDNANRIQWENIPQKIIEIKIFVQNKRIDSSALKIANDLLKENYNIQTKKAEIRTTKYQMKIKDKKQLDDKNTIIEEGVSKKYESINDSVFQVDNYTSSELCKLLEKIFYPKLIYPDIKFNEEFDWTLTLMNPTDHSPIDFDEFRTKMKQKYNIDFLKTEGKETVTIYYTEN